MQQIGDRGADHHGGLHVEAAQRGAQTLDVLQGLAGKAVVGGSGATRGRTVGWDEWRDEDVAKVERGLGICVEAQRVLVRAREAAKRIAGRRCERGGRRIDLGAAAGEEVFERDRGRLDVCLERLGGRDQVDEVGQAAGETLAAVSVEDQRVGRDDVEVADERAVGADEQAVGSEGLDGKEILDGGREASRRIGVAGHAVRARRRARSGRQRRPVR